MKNSKLFSKIYSSYFGEEIDNPKQISQHNFSGIDLKDFCEFYLSHFRTFDEIEAEKSDNKVARVLWFVFGMIAGMVLIYLAIEFNIKLQS